MKYLLAHQDQVLTPLREYRSKELSPRWMPAAMPPPLFKQQPVATQARRETAGDQDVADAPRTIDEVLRSPGQPLDVGTRATMERSFGHDFGLVRVHDDALAARSARMMNAAAYTVGRHVVFDGGFDPASASGRELLAHELTHVVQQRAAGALPRSLDISDARSEHEQEARRVAAVIASTGDPGATRSLPRSHPIVESDAKLIRVSCGVDSPRIDRDVTRPRAATGSAVVADVETQTAGPRGTVSAGTLAKQEWESLFKRHFIEPDLVEEEVESRHARYMYSHIYGWIDAQHFFAHIEFAEKLGVEGATAKGLEIEKKQKVMRTAIGPDADDPTAYSMLLESNLISPDDFLHYREGLFMAIAAGLDLVLSPEERALIKGFDERQLAKFMLDNAMSAYSHEDIVSNQLGVQYFRLHGAHVNAGKDAAEVRARFVNTLTEYLSAIQVENDPAVVKRLGAKLPGKERWTAPKTTEAAARKKFPELFRFDDLTHRVRVAVYDRRETADRKSAELAKTVNPSISLFVTPYGERSFALYAGPTSHFQAVLLKWVIDRAIPTGTGGALVEAHSKPTK